MAFKILFFLIGLIACTLGQVVTESSLTCTYVIVNNAYGCNLQFNNTQGRDDFTEIQGVHLEGRTDADVTVILSTTGRTTNVPQIVCSQFPNLEFLDLTNLGITSLSENAFRGCASLTWLRLWNNGIWQLPANVFEANTALTYLDLDNNWLFELPSGIFTPLVNLEALEIRNNIFSTIPGDTFATLFNLRALYMDNCGINVLNPEWFATLANLQQLILYFNMFETVDENVFENLSNLIVLDLGNNRRAGINLNIHPNAFRNLVNLRQLNLNSVGLLAVDPAWFETLTSLNYLYLSFNRIEELPAGVFENLNELRSLSLWVNELKFLRRNSFGNLATLTFLDLDDNAINAIDENIFLDAIDLRTVYLTNNVCVNGNFFDFINNREAIFLRMRNCFCNFLHYVEIVTDGNVEIFRAFEPGMAFRVNGTEYIVVSLLPTNLFEVPRVSVIIGISNGTRSQILINGEHTVVDISTPGILDPLRFTNFRIVWVNFMISVFRDRETFPFMVYNMREFYPITHYVVFSPTEAFWNIQPLELPADIDTC